ncbi:MATE family efflux transporter [Kitasatospora indigofera]|uniref:MATE family efflux transporter n=1 Tax=Kitasatospora indigofera TaxID=67307 RepID=UPI0036358196
MPQLSTLLRDSRLLAALAVPLALTQLAQVALTTTDTVMMGVLGTEALAAGGLALVVFNQLRTMGVGLVSSVGNQIATVSAQAEPATGRPDTEPSAAARPAAQPDAAPSAAAQPAPARTAAAETADDRIRALVRAALAVATLAGIAGGVLMVLIGQAASLLGQDAGVAARAQQMLHALAPGLVPCLWFQAIRQFTVGMRRPQALLRITVASVAVNAALNWAFVHGGWGLPALGLTGIGVATSMVHLLSFLALYASARRDPGLAPLLSLAFWKADPATVRRLLGLGTPIAATYGSEAGFFSVTALLAGSFGTAALAAHTAVNQLVYVVFQVTVGLSHAASINVSREIALGEHAAARRIRATALACGAGVMAVVGAVYLTLPQLVLRPFFDPGAAADRQGLGIATGLLAVVALLQFFDCAQNIGVGLLRGLDDTGSGFRLTLVGYWLVGLPAAWLLAYPLGGQTRGLWLGLLLGLATTAALLLRRFGRALTSRAGSPAGAAAAATA